MVLTFSGLEIFFVATTIVSLVFNIIQWREGKAAKDPLSNTLVGTFNEIRARVNYVHFAYGTIFSPNNPHADVQTLRWEFGHFLQGELSTLEGLQEQLVSVLVSLRPEDKTGALAFRARDYGLTEDDKEIRRLNFERYKANMSPPLQPSEPSSTKQNG